MENPAAPAADRPNVLIIMFDQVAPSALGCYGNPVVKTPTINAPRA